MKQDSDNKKPATEWKVILLRRGLTVTALAGQISSSRQAVSGTINGSDRFPRVRVKIEEVLHA
jgi:hypothetical protein